MEEEKGKLSESDSPTFKIHPAIGIARVGNSPDEFYLAPETPGGLPIECDAEGKTKGAKEKPVKNFKHKDKATGISYLKRQAARFRIFQYDDGNEQGNELKIGSTFKAIAPKSGQLIDATVTDIEWTVHLANKKAAWYEFQQLDGEYGYSSDHPLRNAAITKPEARQKLIIDPGPQSVRFTDESKRKAEFKKGSNPSYAQVFPPELKPRSIDTLGEVITNHQNNHSRLIVLGGYGNAGTSLTDFGQPYISHYANNDGWFDDVSDGPVTAKVIYSYDVQTLKDPSDPTSEVITKKVLGNVDVQDPAWVIVGYPSYVPEIIDMITMDDVVADVSIRKLGSSTEMYGEPPFDSPAPPDDLDQWRRLSRWNEEYYPHFYRDIWPILQRPNPFQYLISFDGFTGSDPHNDTPGAGGNFDPSELSVAPYHDEPEEDRKRREKFRRFVYGVLRKDGEENDFERDYPSSGPPIVKRLMPDLAGDNPISNTAASKFLKLTETQLFILKQWAEGKFINEKTEGLKPQPEDPGTAIDRGVLTAGLGGAFCPGGEIGWIIRNPAIYDKPYRIKHLPSEDQSGTLSLEGNLKEGLEAGDLTKYSALPWQADFNECSTQDINITYEDWNSISPDSVGDPVQQIIQTTHWWPAHRPWFVASEAGRPVYWSRGIPASNEGDLKMVTAWQALAFIKNVDGQFKEVERNDDQL